jgi:hypothetical protein
MSILLHTSWMTKKICIKDRIKTKLARILIIAVITAYVTITILGLTTINQEAFSGMLG